MKKATKKATPVETLEAGEVASALAAIASAEEKLAKARPVLVTALARWETAHGEEVAAHAETRDDWGAKYESLRTSSDAAIREADAALVSQRHAAETAQAKALDVQRKELGEKHGAQVDKLARELADLRTESTATIKRMAGEAADAAKRAADESKLLATRLATAEEKLKKVQLTLS